VSTAKMLELSDETKRSLEELRALSKAAEDGDKGARQELKRALRESSPEVIVRASDISRKAQHLLIETAAAGDPLIELALSGRMDMMRTEIAGENPTALESLLVERVVACWIMVELFEALMAPQLWPRTPNRIPFAVLKHYLHWQELANRRYFCAIRELGRIRRLQSGLPNTQTNVQINLGGGTVKDPSE
jgi:hypothetical protein